MSTHRSLVMVAAAAALVVPASTAALSVAAAQSEAVPDAQVASLPELGAIDVREVEEASFKVNAVVLPSLVPSTLRVEYGPTSAYGGQTNGQNVPAGTASLTRTLSVTNLQPGTTYHFRVVLSNLFATVAGPATTVTTLGVALPVDPTAAPGAPGGTSAPVTPTSPGAVPPAAPPVLGRRVAVAPAAGVVRVRLPGAERSQPLPSGAAIPAGSVVDTRRGRVEMTSALPGGRTQTATFWGGVFTVRQTPSGMVRLRLPKATGCTRAPAVSSGHSEDARRSKSKPRKRPRKRRPALWGKDKRGRYRTEGSNSVATVRGTKWLVVNRCDGTLTRVREGAVVVRDLKRKRTVLVRAGRSYLARGRR